LSVHYVFVHGWGTDPDFWERLRPHFPEKQSHFLNLGFIGPDKRIENHKAPSDSKRVYITHSLGTLWALKNKASDIDVLIAINGFYRFKSFSDERSLQAIKLRLERDPIPQMGDLLSPIMARCIAHYIETGEENDDFLLFSGRYNHAAFQE